LTLTLIAESLVTAVIRTGSWREMAASLGVGGVEWIELIGELVKGLLQFSPSEHF
jgi:hypothetical protein